MNRKIRSPYNSDIIIEPASTKNTKFSDQGGIIIGSDNNDANNVKLHRGASSQLDIVTGDDITADGTFSTNKIILGTKGVTIGTDPILANNVRLHRSGSAQLQIVPSDDVTPEGSISPTPAEILGASPTGLISAYGGSTAPTGWLLCDGSSVSTTTYARLFSVLAYAYGGAGANFNLPDLRNKFPKGKYSGDVLGATGGSNTLIDHTHTSVLTAAGHTNTVGATSVAGSVGGSDGTHTHGDNGHQHGNYTTTGGTNLVNGLLFSNQASPTQNYASSTGYAQINTTNSGHGHAHSLTYNISHSHPASAVTGSIGTGSVPSSTDNRPSFQTVNYIIKA